MKHFFLILCLLGICITGVRDVEQIAYGLAYLEDTTTL